ncbi:tRNA_pseudouridine synthase [Hexamita inflata]|uniref:tRNA pseudouridine synthase n=1 Tax=Hexamita inflata TaxID=28002 RepID=A0ABP1IT80_9EUKA
MTEQQPIQPEVQPEPVVQQEAAPIREKKPKKLHVVIACGYVGTNYNGSQMQNGKNALVATTIEGEIAKVLIKLGYCPEDDLRQIDMERTSRTDSKVSAAMAIFSLWCTNTTTLHEELNEHLPADIRVYGVMRTTPRFDCRAMCTSRRYEYLAPVQMFYSTIYEEKKAQYKAFLAEQQANLELIARPESFVMQQVEFVQPEAGLTNEQLVKFFNENTREKLNQFTKMCYSDYNAYYYNFTSENKISTISSTVRKYDQFEFNEAFLINGKAFTKISIHGIAFLYNQIRKMVTAVSLVARNQCPPSWMSRALTGRVEFKTEIPTAPGEYLMLLRQEFKGYEKSEEMKIYGDMLSNREEIKQKAEQFKQIIHEQILAVSDEIWQGYLAQMDEFATHVDGYELGKEAVLREIKIAEILRENKVQMQVQME